MISKKIVCEVCRTEIEDFYCTENVCEECCRDGKCPCDSWCMFKKKERDEECLNRL